MNFSNNIQSYLYQGYPDLSINDPVVPSAPPMETARASQVNWKVLPPAPDPKWHQVAKIREAIKTWAFNLSLLTGLGTVYAGVWFTAKPIVVLCTFSGLGLVTLALAVTGLALSRLAPHPLDREFRISQRLCAQDESQNHTLAFNQRKTYGETILANEEWQDLLQSDISTMTYSQFLIKHREEVLPFLNEKNRNSLKFKYIVHLMMMNEAGNKGLKEVLEGSKAKYFGVTIDVLARDFVAAELYRMYENETDYQEFVNRNGLEAIQYVLNSNYRDWFVKKFIDNVNERMTGKGTAEAERVFAQDFASFGELIQKAALESVAWHSLHELIGKKIDYATFRQRIDLSHLQRLIAQYSNIKEFVKNSYLTLSFHFMKTWLSDREILNIDFDECKENLRTRWTAMTIQDILQNQAIASDFFEATREIFSPSDWTQKVVAETSSMTIQQILNMSTTLLTSKILTAETVLASGKTLKNQLEEEISSCSSLEQFVSLYPGYVLYDQGVLSKENAKISSLIIDFMVRHPIQYLFASSYASSGEQEIQEFIKKYVQIPEVVQNILLESQCRIQREKCRFEQIEAERKRNLDLDLTGEKLKREAALNRARDLYQIDNLKKNYDDAKNAKETAERKITHYNNEIEKLNCELNTMVLASEADNKALMECLACINTLSAHHGRAIELIPQMKASITRLGRNIVDTENRMKATLESDSVLNRFRREIDILTEAGQVVELREQKNKLAQEVSGFSSVKELLRSQIAEVEKVLDQEVTGVFAAVGALASKSRYEGEIAAKKRQIAEMEKKEETLIRLGVQIQTLETKHELKPYVSLSKTSISHFIEQNKGRISTNTKMIESQFNILGLREELQKQNSNLQEAERQMMQLDTSLDKSKLIKLNIQIVKNSIEEKKTILWNLEKTRETKLKEFREQELIYTRVQNEYFNKESLFNGSSTQNRLEFR